MAWGGGLEMSWRLLSDHPEVGSSLPTQVSSHLARRPVLEVPYLEPIEIEAKGRQDSVASDGILAKRANVTLQGAFGKGKLAPPKLML